jgi:hypothetical protein
VDRPGYGTDGRPGAVSIELQYLPDDTVAVRAADVLRGDAGEPEAVLASGDGDGVVVSKERAITVNGKAKQMHSRCRWRDRRGQDAA